MIDSFAGEYNFLSNFYFSEVEFEGLRYPSNEHAFQAAKTLHATDRRIIQGLSSPGMAKKIGREVNLRSDWQNIRVSVMEGLVRQKFNRLDLKAKLLATGDEELVEGNWWGDTFWGICKGKGENNLGKILMKVREELRG